MTQPENIKLFNTYTRELEALETMAPGEVSIYCCGPTVYNYQHIGNFKTFIFEDILVRTLRFAGYKVNHVMNITDVGHLAGDNDEGEDKMKIAMKREKKKSHEIADHYSQKFFEDWDQLNLQRPSVTCKATEHIQEMIDLIKRIEQNGYSYQKGGNVYFDAAKFDNYGKLAMLDVEKLKAGARVEVDPNKKNPQDFVLWFTQSKFENQELTWDSPWGTGYPGWHIECSAMSMKYLGDQFDIHCGGIDHIPVHHTNEIAQSEAATGSHWVRIWMHSEFLMMNDEKMSKSKGGFLLLDDLIEQGFEPMVYRMLLLSAHYKAHMNFSKEAMENAKRSSDKLKNAVLNLKKSIAEDFSGEGSASYQELLGQFKAAMFNDLNTPQALAVVWKTIGSGDISDSEKLELLYKFDSSLGLGMEKWQEEKFDIPEEVQQLVSDREQARKNKDWAAADQARDKIAALGFRVEDSAAGQKVKKL